VCVCVYVCVLVCVGVACVYVCVVCIHPVRARSCEERTGMEGEGTGKDVVNSEFCVCVCDCMCSDDV